MLLKHKYHLPPPLIFDFLKIRGDVFFQFLALAGGLTLRNSTWFWYVNSRLQCFHYFSFKKKNDLSEIFQNIWFFYMLCIYDIHIQTLGVQGPTPGPTVILEELTLPTHPATKVWFIHITPGYICYIHTCSTWVSETQVEPNFCPSY